MSKRLTFFIAALCLATPLAARQAAEPPLDPACPAAGHPLPRGPDWLCLGTLNEDYSFASVYPKSVERVPALDAAVRAEAARGAAWIAAEAQRSRAERRMMAPMRYEARWQVDAILPEVAAASAAIGHHVGGAHGGIEYKTILIDPRRGRRLVLADLFRPGFLESRTLGDRIHGVWAVQDAFCRALTAEVRDRRDDPAAAVACPNVEEQPVTLVCGGNGRIDRMRTLLNPYVIGSWAEGPYEIEFPIDAMIMDGMKRRYRSAFGLARESRPRSPLRPCR